MARRTTKAAKRGKATPRSGAKQPARRAAKGRAAPTAPDTARAEKPRTGEARTAPAIEHAGSARELFWQNILRELLVSLSILSAQRSGGAIGAPAAPPGGGDSPLSGVVPQVLGEGVADARASMGEDEDDEDSAPGELGEGGLVRAPAGPPNLFDGRLAVITTLGQRIAIGGVEAVFACNIPSERGWLASAVECSVFQITTPEGEVFTLPLSEIRAFHSLTPELMEKLERTAQEQVEPEKDVPFGFAAFRSLANANRGRVPEMDPDSWGE